MISPYVDCLRGAVARRFARVVFLLPLLALGLHAQTGVLTGFVTNQATGDLLPGAVLAVEGTGVTGATERGGGFTLTVPAGQHTLLVSYAGLDPARVTVAVTAGGTVRKDIGLTSGVYKMDAFAVKGVREGSALAIQTQRQADNPKWVAATDTFGNPAANPGELIQRLPGITTETVGSEVRTIQIRGLGPGFSSLLVDGERMASSGGTSAIRDYQIEQMGTANLETVELIKAPLPDQDANAVAGYVNLVPRRAFDTPGRRITVTGGVLWRKRGFSGSLFEDKADNLDLFGLAYSDVFNAFGGERNLGIAFNVGRRVSYTTQDEIGPGGVLYNFAQTYLNPNSANPLTRLFGTGDFGYAAKSRNSGLSIDYKASPDLVLFARLGFNTNDQYQVYYRPGFGNPAATAANFTADSTYERSVLLPHAASVGILESTPAFSKNSRNYSLSGGAEAKLFQRSAKLELRGSWSHADISYPGWIRAQARTTAPGGIGFEIDRRGQDPWYPIFRQTAGPSIYDPASYTMNFMQKQSYKAPNDLYTARLDFTKNFETALPFSIKAGLKYADDKRKAESDFAIQTFVGADGIANTADDVLTPYADSRQMQGDGRYGPFPFAKNPASAPANFWRQTAADAYNSFVTANAGDVAFRESITAAYLMGRSKIGPVRVVAGVRMEDTETEGTGWVRNTTASWGGNSVGGASLDPATVAANVARAQRSFVRRNTAGGDYRHFFPGLHFVYGATETIQVRASYNRAISRPPVANLLPNVTENTETNTVTIGNPDLKPYLTNNYEISVEKYFEPVGQFSVGVFRKDISNYFATVLGTVPTTGTDGNGLYAGYTLSRALNVGNARVRGIEANYTQQLSFLPGVWRGLGVFANYTYLETKGNFGTTVTANRLANLAPRSGNGGINFRYRGFDARLLANWVAEKFKGTTAPIDVYNEERLMIDVKLQYSINRRYDVFLDATNIFDESPRTDVSLNGLKFFKTNQGIGFVAGVRGRF